MKQLIIAASIVIALASCSDSVRVRTFQGQPMKVKNGWDISVAQGDTIIIESAGLYDRDWYIPNSVMDMKDTTIGVFRRDTLVSVIKRQLVVVTKQ